jgi:Flp pilus assembly pilin Flp
MSSRGNPSRSGSENGAVAAEYAPLLVVIAVLVVIAMSFIGPWVGRQLSDASDPLDAGAAPALVRVTGDAFPAP